MTQPVWTRLALVAGLCALVLPPALSQDAPMELPPAKITLIGSTIVGIALPLPRSDAASAGSAEDILSTVRADLDFSGFFRLVKPELWAGMDLTQAEVDYTSWQAMEADFLVLSMLSLQGDQLTLEGRLYDVKRKEMVTGKRIKGPARDARTLAHNLSSVILDYLFGGGKFPTSQLVFTSQVGNTQDIFLCDYDGRGLLRLTALGILNVTPHVNFRGDRIVFTSILKDRHELFLLDRAGRRTKLYGQGEGLNSSPKFSPDAATVAFCTSRAGNPDVWTVGVDGKGVQRLTSSWAIDTAPTWAPDGRQLAFTSDRGGSPQIYVMDRDGSNVKRLSPEGSGRCDQPAWSPRGDKVAYATSVRGRFEIAVLDLTTNQVALLTQNGSDDEAPCWSPDGRYLAFASNRTGSYQIFIMRADGSGVTQVSRQPNCYDPCWF